jgi:hypothetical protein
MRTEVDRALIGKLEDELSDAHVELQLALPRIDRILKTIWADGAEPRLNVRRIVDWAETNERLPDVLSAMRDRLTRRSFDRLVREIEQQLDEIDASTDEHGEPVASARRRTYEMIVLGVKDRRTRTIDYGPDRQINHQQISLDTANVLRRWHAAQQLIRDDELQMFGTHLFYLLFGFPASAGSPANPDDDGRPQMLQKLARLCAALDADSQSYLQIVLQFAAEATELAELPWELLFVPTGAVQLRTADEQVIRWPSNGFFLTAHDRITLMRAQGNSKPPQTGRAKPPLKVVVVDSRALPAGPPEPAAQPEPAAGKANHPFAWMCGAALERIEWGQVLTRPGRAQLGGRCGDAQVVHLLGSGQSAGDEDRFVLCATEMLTVSELADALRGARLVIFHAETRDSYAVFFRIALKLLPASLQRPGSTLTAVVAVQLDADATANFAQELYAALSRGEPVEVALQSARLKLGIARGEFGRPMLLTRSWGALIAEDGRQGPPPGVLDTPIDTRGVVSSPSSPLDLRIQGARERGP